MTSEPSPVRVAAAVETVQPRVTPASSQTEPEGTGLPLWGGVPAPAAEALDPLPAAAPSPRAETALPLWPPVGGFTGPR